MRVSATVPTRIDLAGGTLDVYPLYLFEGGGLTVNAAINIYGHIVVAERCDGRIRIRSDDSDTEEIFDGFRSLEANVEGGLRLAKLALRYYIQQSGYARGLDVVLRSDAPRGSGLGASSALLMGLSGALNEVVGLGYDKSRLIAVGADIEAQVIGIPTGKQDYFPPLFGGVCSVWFDVGGHQLERLDVGNDLIKQLNARLLLAFTNINRFSGLTNWSMLKRYIENQGDTVARMKRIKKVALTMRDSLKQSQLDKFATLLADEWQNRRGLAAGVSTPEIDAMIAAARSAGAQASKLCGAGGGGCMVTLADAKNHDDVKNALASAGATILPFRIVPDGIRLEMGE